MRFAFLIEPPFNYRTDTGSVTGTDVEVARVICRELDLGQFEPVETTFAELIPGVVARKWTMTTGLFATDERKRHALFSRPIWALPDGLLVSSGNPKALTGYRSIAAQKKVKLAVIRDQVQHQTALASGVQAKSIRLFETYEEAAAAVKAGRVDAYASVARAHAGYLAVSKAHEVEMITVSSSEKPPEYGAFAFHPEDTVLCDRVDGFLDSYLGSARHRETMCRFGFADSEIDLIAEPGKWKV